MVAQMMSRARAWSIVFPGEIVKYLPGTLMSFSGLFDGTS